MALLAVRCVFHNEASLPKAFGKSSLEEDAGGSTFGDGRKDGDWRLVRVTLTVTRLLAPLEFLEDYQPTRRGKDCVDNQGWNTEKAAVNTCNNHGS